MHIFIGIFLHRYAAWQSDFHGSQQVPFSSHGVYAFIYLLLKSAIWMIKIVLLMLHVAVITIVYLWCTIATAETIYWGHLLRTFAWVGISVWFVTFLWNTCKKWQCFTFKFDILVSSLSIPIFRHCYSSVGTTLTLVLGTALFLSASHYIEHRVCKNGSKHMVIDG